MDKHVVAQATAGIVRHLAGQMPGADQEIILDAAQKKFWAAMSSLEELTDELDRVIAKQHPASLEHRLVKGIKERMRFALTGRGISSTTADAFI